MRASVNGLRRLAVLAASAVAIGAALAGGAVFLAPRAQESWDWLSAADAPEELTRLGLAASLTPERLQAELAAALEADDIDLAASFLELARQQGLAPPARLADRYAAATTTAASAARNAREFYRGAVDGEAASGAGLAGVVAADVSGLGDIRDLVREGRKMSRGDEADQLVIGLAGVGLAVTGATLVTLGAAMPVRAGVSTVKVAARTGRLSRPLAASLTKLVGEAVDVKGVKIAAAAAARLDLAAARQAAREAVRPAALARLGAVAADVTAIGRHGGVRAAHEALAMTRDAGELRRVARLAETRGLGTRAVLKVLGRGAIALTSGVVIFAGWVMAATGYAWLALLLVLALVKRAARMALWSGRKTAQAIGGAVRLAAAPREPVAVRLGKPANGGPDARVIG